MNNDLSSLLTRFRKNHNTQQYLLTTLEKWTNKLDKRKLMCVMFMNLSKAFDSINHNLLVAKLEAYGFSGTSLQLMRSYLKNCKQRVYVNSSFSEWETVSIGILQGSIFNPLLFNIFLNDFFLVVTHFHLSNYFRDINLHCFRNNTNHVDDKLRIDLVKVMNWSNADKCYYMRLGKDTENAKLHFDGNT